ncbi:ATP-dependent DNA helicase [Thermodesulfobacteriota bacterium]
MKDFEYRSSQIQMAELIAKAIRERNSAIIEAGTGTGKTIGYLIPLVLSGTKCVISTATKNLQEQIFYKDIPLLSRATGLKINAVLMKGRRNYLCLNRFHQYFSRTSLLRSDQHKLQKKLENWLRQTEFADLAELEWMREDDPLWDALCSSSDRCLGSTCIHQEDCYLNALRRRAAQARLIIVNHHLFFADLMVKREGFGEIIPRFKVVVFDEAHDIEEIATIYFGENVSTYQFQELVDDLKKEMKEAEEKKEPQLERHLHSIKAGAEVLRDFFNDRAERERLNQETLQLIQDGPAQQIRASLDYLVGDSGLPASHAVRIRAIISRAEELGHRLIKILSYRDPRWLVWYEKRKKSVVLYASPLEIGEDLQELLYQKLKTTVYTSATLSTKGNFGYIRFRLGLDQDVLEGIYPSHFDFAHQTLLYIPKDLPLPGAPDFGPKISERIADIINLSAGRALVLFTSHHNLNFVHQLLQKKIPYRVHKQGDAPRSILLEGFKRETDSVLLATGSFWQGVDVPGEALSCLIIDKLPFDSPGDPLVAGRIESCRNNGGNPFMDYQLPSAIISLKQGLGRLIRNSSDRGILSVLDKRIITKQYGRFFLDSLPAIPVSHDVSDIKGFLNFADKQNHRKEKSS